MSASSTSHRAPERAHATIDFLFGVCVLVEAHNES